MEIIDRTEKRNSNSIVELVNPLVSQAFGRPFKGNCDYEFHRSLVSGPEGIKEIDRLCMIGRKRLFGLAGEFVGQLGTVNGEEMDGSRIAVFPHYVSEARKYAELYHAKTGRDVTVVVTDVINPSERKILE